MVVIQEMSIAQAQDGFKSGNLTAKELTFAFLRRIEAFDKAGPRINAMMALSTTAIEEAASLDRYSKETGKFKGKLHGIPIVGKDQADTKGIVTAYGSAVGMNNVPDKDAFAITKLKEAGAVILGKTSNSFKSLTPRWISSLPEVSSGWNACLQALERHNGYSRRLLSG